MHKQLGILITSERHGTHIIAIVPAARRKNIELFVHISGSGVRLCLQERIQKVLARVPVTICRQSARRFGLEEQIRSCCPGTLTAPHRAPLNIDQCHRRIVL